MRCIEMQAEEKRLLGFRIVANYFHRAVAEQIRQVTSLVNFSAVVPEIVGVSTRVGLVRKVIQRPALKTPEVIVAALERTVIRQIPQMPFSDERRAISC